MKHQLLIAGFGIVALMAVSSASAADATKGADVFKKKCGVCHSVKAGEKKLGPNMSGVVGRQAGTDAGYKYSDGFTGVAWDAATLDKYLTSPKALLPKTKMTFTGLKEAADRENVIEFLGAQK